MHSFYEKIIHYIRNCYNLTSIVNEVIKKKFEKKKVIKMISVSIIQI